MIAPLMDSQKQLYDGYSRLQVAISLDDNALQAKALSDLREASVRKTACAVPIVQKLRQYGGLTIDLRLREMVSEMANAVSPRE